MAQKYTLAGLAYTIEMEGLDGAIQHYVKSSDIADLELAKMWDEAKNLLDRIDKHIHGHHVEVGED